MSALPNLPDVFASNDNYAGGPDIGTPTKVAPASVADGYRGGPANPPIAQEDNYLNNQVTRWLRAVAGHTALECTGKSGSNFTWSSGTFIGDDRWIPRITPGEEHRIDSPQGVEGIWNVSGFVEIAGLNGTTFAIYNEVRNPASSIISTGPLGVGGVTGGGGLSVAHFNFNISTVGAVGPTESFVLNFFTLNSLTSVERSLCLFRRLA